MSVRTAALTVLAMLAFASNSLLGRLALGEGLIDPASFASVRILAGALLLSAIVWPRWRSKARARADWRSIAMLLAYMVSFSFAYLSLGAGTGALILFGAVQLTMFGVALAGGERFPLIAWAGLALAALGLVYLVAPGLAAPDPGGAILMSIAGSAWGAYTLLGRGVRDPLEATANNFLWSAPFVVLVSIALVGRMHASASGVLLAAASGALSSALGYTIWYAALRGLAATRAATVQLSVPVLAALGGAVLLAEPITPRLVWASLMTLGGIWIVLGRRARPVPPRGRA